MTRRDASDALAKYVDRFGPAWVEQRGISGESSHEIRLKPFNEYRALLESHGRFLLIQSEEITGDDAHINAANIAETIQPLVSSTLRETIATNFRAVHEQSRRLGRPMLPHLNHPNLGNRGVSAEDLATILEDQFFEIFNGVEGDGELGSDTRHSVERLWDIASTLRIATLQAPPMYGLAVDDSHNFHGRNRQAQPGRGWVMVRARHLTPESIIRALNAGDFYGSSGVTLNQIEFANDCLRLEIMPDGDARYTTQFIGTRQGADLESHPRKHPTTGEPIAGTRDYSAEVGQVLATVEGLRPQYVLAGDEFYVRAVVTSDRPPPHPSAENMWQKAWTQPVGWQRHLPTGKP